VSKQTFTTGQVLTAAQVNTLQSNDFNQTVSVKTAAHTLVVGDRGTRVEFNTSGSVTCTVNSGIFDAGDTLVIQNRGAGVVTVTAGTATVNTSATLALSQYDAGTLYFISASAAIFFNTDAGGGSPLTTKGDLYGFSTLDARIPIGANNTVLTADSSESLGLKWAAPAAGGANWSLFNAGGTNLTGSATITVSGISGKDQILIGIQSASSANASSLMTYQFNGDSGANYDAFQVDNTATSTYSASQFSNDALLLQTEIYCGTMSNNAASTVTSYIMLSGCNAAGVKAFFGVGGGKAGGAGQTGHDQRFFGGVYNSSSTISSVSIKSSSGNFDGGKIYVWTTA